MIKVSVKLNFLAAVHTFKVGVHAARLVIYNYYVVAFSVHSVDFAAQSERLIKHVYEYLFSAVLVPKRHLKPFRAKLRRP